MPVKKIKKKIAQVILKRRIKKKVGKTTAHFKKHKGKYAGGAGAVGLAGAVSGGYVKGSYDTRTKISVGKPSTKKKKKRRK